MPALTPAAVVSKATLLEKGGLFVVLLVVLYLGYDIYLKGREGDQQLILNQLYSISQQQVNLQQSILTTQAAMQSSQDDVKSVLRKINTLEESMVRYVYFDAANNTLVVRAPQAQGGQVVEVTTKPAKEDKQGSARKSPITQR